MAEQHTREEPDVTPTNATPTIDAKRVVILVTAAVVGSVLVTAGIIAAVIAALGKTAWWSGWSAALVAGLTAAVASVLPLVPGILGGAQTAVYGYLAAAFIRVIVALGTCMAAVFVWHTPPVPTLMLAVPLYFAQVAAEAVVLSRAFWPGK